MLEARIVEGPGFFNRYCCICRGDYETRYFDARLFWVEDGKEEKCLGFICPHCLDIGPPVAASEAREWAEWFAELASDLESGVARWVSKDELKEKNEECEEECRREIEACRKEYDKEISCGSFGVQRLPPPF